MAVKLLGVAPSGATDAATKGYVDGAIRAVTVNTTANNRDIILANASGGSITITLPVTAGARVTVKKTDSSGNAVIVSCSGTVDGDPNATLLGQDASAIFVGDGTNAQIEAINGSSAAVGPSGTITMFGGAAAPPGYLLCDGSAVSRTTYANLFAAIGTTFGVGDGSTTFNVPNMQDQLPMGKSGTKALGSAGGTDTHQHALSANGYAQMNPFTGAYGANLKSSGVTAWNENTRTSGTTGTPSTGITRGVPLGGTSDNVTTLPPYVALNYIIKI